MWEQVGQSLSGSMTRMLSHLASLLPGIIALIAAVLLSALVAWIFAAVLRRSLTGIGFDARVAQWGFPALAEWSPSESPTLLVTRVAAWTIILIGLLIGISAFDVALTSESVSYTHLDVYKRQIFRECWMDRGRGLLTYWTS